MRSTAKLSGTVAALGVASVAFLEIAHAPASQTMAQSWSVGAAILIGGLLRWYMFYEGTALGAYSQKDAKKALAFSVVLAVGLFLYGVFLAVVGSFEWHLFALFALVNLGLVFAEWVFGRRTSYIKPAAVMELEKRVGELVAALSGKTEQAAKADADLRAITTRADQLAGDVARLEAANLTIKNRLSDLEEVVSDHVEEILVLSHYQSAAQSAFFIDDGGRFKVCRCGQKTYATNRQNTVVCNCGQVLFQK